MITKFDSLFAGHIDRDDVGYGGTPVNDRRFPNEQLATVFDKAIEKRYPGLDRVSVSLSVGVPKALCLEQLERFAAEVMPAFSKAKRAAPAMA